jgi:peptide-methionine (S)-S-oxide reductase
VLFAGSSKRRLPTAAEALPGRSARPYRVPATHAVLGTPLEGPWPQGTQVAYVAMGCFWGAERAFWSLPGVVTTAVGYMGGITAHPTYEETCTGRTGHTEAVLVAFDPAVLDYADLLKVFWESHDPTQGNRQGNDVGTQYRSAVYWQDDEQREAVERSRAAYQQVLDRAGYGGITTDVRPAAEAGPFYYAEDYHQQYLHKVPNGYCGLGGTGVSCPVGV